MAKLSQVKQSKKKETEGVWIHWEQGIQLKIARAGNPLFKKISEDFGATNRALNEKGKPEVPFSALEMDLLCRSTLLDWRNVEDDNGKPIPYTPEEGQRILSDSAYEDLKDFILRQSVKRQNFLETGEAQTEKNSVPLSSQILKLAETSGVPSKLGENQTTQIEGQEPNESSGSSLS